MTRLRLRDRIYRPGVARAITSPVGIMAGSLAAGAVIATGAPVLGAVVAGALAWAVPVVRAMRAGTRATRDRRPVVDDLPSAWAAHVTDAGKALERYRRALRRCPPGPLHERLEDIESEFVESVALCGELARWGAEAEGARHELDPAAFERVSGDATGQALSVAEDQEEVSDRLAEVMHEARARLVLINGRLDGAVGRAVEMAGRASRVGRYDERGLDRDAVKLADELRALREALEEVGVAGPVRPREKGPSRNQRRAR